MEEMDFMDEMDAPGSGIRIQSWSHSLFNGLGRPGKR